MSDLKDISALVDTAELQQFNNASFQVIKKLQEKVSQLESENESLKLMLEQNVPTLHFADIGIGISNEHIICLTQIALLKEKAVSSKTQLTMEEVKKLEILTKVLAGIKAQNPDDPEDIKAKSMTPEELLKSLNE
jgi:hypothetical protein